MAKTELFVRKQPGGMFAVVREDLTTGEIFFVHSGTGANAAGGGRNPDSPLATIDYAVGLCAADKYDRIYVMPGHAETLTAAAQMVLDVAGISVIGLGRGANKPQITLGTATTTDIDIDAANVSIENLDFIAAFADVAVCIDVNADNFTMRGCRFSEATNLNFLVCVQDAAAGGSDQITVEQCFAFCPDAANTHFVNLSGTGDRHIIRFNTLFGDWGTMAIGGTGVVTNCLITDNDIRNKATDNDSCIKVAATATGMIRRNMATGGAAQANGFTGAAAGPAQNFYGVVDEDLSAILDPIAT